MFCSGTCIWTWAFAQGVNVMALVCWSHGTKETTTAYFTRVLWAQTVHLNNGKEWPTYCVRETVTWCFLRWHGEIRSPLSSDCHSLLFFVRSHYSPSASFALFQDTVEMYEWPVRILWSHLAATASSSWARELNNNQKTRKIEMNTYFNALQSSISPNINKNDAIITLG